MFMQCFIATTIRTKRLDIATHFSLMET